MVIPSATAVPHAWVSAFVETKHGTPQPPAELWEHLPLHEAAAPSVLCCVLPLQEAVGSTVLWFAVSGRSRCLFTSTFKKKAKHLLFEGRHACIPGNPGNAMADTRLGKHSGCFKVTVIAYCAFLFCPQEIIKLMIPFPGKSRNSINFSDSS